MFLFYLLVSYISPSRVTVHTVRQGKGTEPMKHRQGTRRREAVTDTEIKWKEE